MLKTRCLSCNQYFDAATLRLLECFYPNANQVLAVMILTRVFWPVGSWLGGGSRNQRPTWWFSAGWSADHRPYRRLACRCTLCVHWASYGRRPWRRGRPHPSTMQSLLSTHCWYWLTSILSFLACICFLCTLFLRISSRLRWLLPCLEQQSPCTSWLLRNKNFVVQTARHILVNVLADPWHSIMVIYLIKNNELKCFVSRELYCAWRDFTELPVDGQNDVTHVLIQSALIDHRDSQATAGSLVKGAIWQQPSSQRTRIDSNL